MSCDTGKALLVGISAKAEIQSIKAKAVIPPRIIAGATLKPRIYAKAVLPKRITAKANLNITTYVIINENAVKIEYSANADIPPISVVTSTGFIADSNNSAHKGKVIGIDVVGTANNHVGQSVLSGEVEYSGWNWTTGSLLFLNGTSLSNTPPATGWSQSIGTALSPTKIAIELSQTTLL